MGTWEIRGLFGNEYAIEQVVEELKKHKGFVFEVLDRRNISVRFDKRNESVESLVKRTFDIHHGWVESEAPLGEYDHKRKEAKEKRAKKDEKKRKLAAKKK